MNLKNKIAAAIVVCASVLPGSAWAQHADFHVVPLPKEVKNTQAGSFELNARTLIAYPKGDKAMKRNAEYLAVFIKEATGLQLLTTTEPLQRKCIRMSAALKDENPEAYNIRVNSDIILLDGASAAGVFYACQTLRKALPMGQATSIHIPSVEVTDEPRFAYRGAHLDVSRHFVTTDSIRRFIDMLALHNINRFHWHLTDDQGWRIEIKKYPKLTEIGSRRAQTVIGHNSGKYDGKPYGGYYTQKEIKDIVRYAAERYITIIPEIDLPGHMQAALAAYPELGCTGGPYDVWQIWGVSDNVLCAGNDKTFEFIDNMLKEVVKLFPSTYIHVGGDECPKTQWAKCAKCQARIKANNLQADGKHTAEERLQSYVIKRAENTLNKLGRQMIGWDETLEGGLAPNATVMSWRGEGGGIEAARQKHDVIMTPNTYLYFDYYQSADTKNEPEAIGGFLPIERVYSYEPMPKSLTPEEQKHIIGVQANCWTEYMKTYRQVEYMELPRMAALSEIQWCAPEQKNFDAFMQRLPKLIDLYRIKNYNYAHTIYNVKMACGTDTAERAIKVTLSTFDGADIHYTLDGTAPTASSPKYEGNLLVRQSGKLRAAAFRTQGQTPEVQEDFTFHKATACPITLTNAPHKGYDYSGAPLLVDGLRGNNTNYRTGRWIGFVGKDLQATIDLGELKEVSQVNVNTCVEKGDWIFGAREFKVRGAETEGGEMRELAVKTYPQMTEETPNGIHSLSLSFAPTKVRFIQVTLKPESAMPQWHSGKGSPAFIFVDEIEVK